jgi:hypothetical protein
LNALNSSDRQALAQDYGPDKQVLVLESVVVTGSTLGRISEFFREFNNLKVTYFCGLLRPDSQHKRRQFRTELGAHDHGSHRLYIADDVILPNWHKEDCPWCREADILSESILKQFQSDEAALQQLRTRRAFLRSGADVGISAGAFLSSPGGGDPLRLGQNSVLLNVGEVNRYRIEAGLDAIAASEVSEADVAVCLASIAQLWREPFFQSFMSETLSDAPKDDNGEDSPCSAFDRVKDNVISGRTTFTDPIIRAAIWRAFRNSELLPRPSGEEADFKDFVSSVLGTAGDGPNDRRIRDELLLLLGLSDFPFGSLVDPATDHATYFQLSSHYRKQ